MIFTLKWLLPYWRRHAVRMTVIVVFGMMSAALHAYLAATSGQPALVASA